METKSTMSGRTSLLCRILFLALTALMLVFFRGIPAEAASNTQNAETSVHAAPTAADAADATDATASVQAATQTATFYQKLQKGKSVRIAVLGDSIACSTGVEEKDCWNTLLKNWLKKKYKSRVRMDNYAIGGTSSYTGYYQCHTAMAQEIQKNGAYDLVIVCYGQNDADAHFGLIYEGLLRQIKISNPNACLITFLESSQETYTDKMLQIIYLSYLYGADIADTISAAALTGKSFEEFHPDGIHPGVEGHQVYFETLQKIVQQGIEIGRTPTQLPAPLSENAALLDDYGFLPLESCRQPDGSFQLVTTQPTLGVVCCNSPQSSSIHLDFSNGEVWDFNAATFIPPKWTSAELAKIFLAPGTVVTLADPEGNISDTVIGFIVSGH